MTTSLGRPLVLHYLCCFHCSVEPPRHVSPSGHHCVFDTNDRSGTEGYGAGHVFSSLRPPPRIPPAGSIDRTAKQIPLFDNPMECALGAFIAHS